MSIAQHTALFIWFHTVFCAMFTSWVVETLITSGLGLTILFILSIFSTIGLPERGVFLTPKLRNGIDEAGD